MYIVGAVEIVLVRLKIHIFKPIRANEVNVKFLFQISVHFPHSIQQTYMAPWLSIFGDFTKDPEIMYNNFRVYGTGLLLVMGEFLTKCACRTLL